MRDLSSEQRKYEQVIVEYILKFIEPEAIILYGGYGRDEGSWVLSEAGPPKPYNDFDILIINDQFITNLDEISDRIKDKIDIRWIDLAQHRRAELRKLKNSILHYDLKYASKVIYGDEQIYNEIPSFDSAEIPLIDIDHLFRTRLWTLVGSIERSGLVEYNGDESTFFRNQMAKAVLASIDCFLLLRKSYHWSYIRRVERFTDLCRDEVQNKLARWALEEKLRPKGMVMTKKEVRTLYKNVAMLFVENFFIGLSRYYNCEVHDYRSLKRVYLHNIKNFLKRKTLNVIKGNRLGDKRVYITILQYLCVEYELNEADDVFEELKRVAKEFKFYGTNFSDIRVFTAKTRNQII